VTKRRDPRSVCLGLSTDGFEPYNTDSTMYSCWPVFIMPYNIPPNKCLKQGFIFMPVVIPGPKHPKNKINMFLRLLFKELKKLWQGIDAYDSRLKCRFNSHVAYMWSIHDYLAYEIFVGWCVHGWLNCPICMEDSDAFRLHHGKKVTFSYCHEMFLSLNHPFRSDKRSFLKGKTIRKVPPK
jgi:hypothetical protein